MTDSSEMSGKEMSGKEMSVKGEKQSQASRSQVLAEGRYGPISLKAHAINDFVALSFVLVSPWLFSYSEHSLATAYAIAMFIGGILLNVVSDYPLGLFKVLPMKWHRMIELTTPGIFIVTPWLLFSDAGAMPWCLSFAGGLIVLNCVFTRELSEGQSESV